MKGVSEVASRVKVPISAVLGVWEWKDIVQYIMVGATTVQSATAVIMQGYNIVKKWLGEIASWMEKRGYESIDEFKGIALKNILRTKDVERAPKKISINVDGDRCVGCGECVISCFYEAITLKNGKASINHELCDVCGLCFEKCPVDAIYISQYE